MRFLKSWQFFFTVMFIIFFFIALSVYRFIDFVRFNQNARLGRDFINEVNQSVINYGEVNFDTITTFEWDKLLIIFPYTYPKQIFEERGLEWRRIRGGIRGLDDLSIVIFLNDNHIVHYFTFLGNVMCHHTMRSGVYPMFSREDTVFYPCPDGRFSTNICLVPVPKGN